MDLLVSKTLLACLLVLAVRFGLVEAAAGVNATCIDQQRADFNADIKRTIETLDKIYIGADATLFTDDNVHS